MVCPTTSLHRAFQYFNVVLFAGSVPPCRITLNASGPALGYFSWRRFKQPGLGLDEIALNPDYVRDATSLQILSVLAHEMCHSWQHQHGRPTPDYHDHEFARCMIAIGLVPSTTGRIGGSPVGPKMAHVILRKGTFFTAAKALVARGYFPHGRPVL